MNTSKLGNQYSVRFTYDQSRAIEALKLNGYNKTKFIRLAIEEKLIRDFRVMLTKVNNNECPF